MTKLQEAYLSSTYWILGTVPVPLRVGFPNATVAHFLGDAAAGHAAFLTPCNPKSVPLTTSINAELMAKAQVHLGAMGLNFSLGVSTGADGCWCEPGMLVWPISFNTAMDLARAWHQNAFIWLDEGWMPCLVMTDTESRQEASLP